MVSLVVQSFGREYEYRRAILCILSCVARGNSQVDDVILFTDQPAYFGRALADVPVRYVLLTPEKIKAMRGSVDFLHRMKIALLEEAFAMTTNKILYVDSDAFFLDDLSARVDALTSGESYMHVLEYRFDTLRQMALPAGEPFHAFLNFIESHTFDLPSGPTRVLATESSWNAGIMAFHPDHVRLLPDVYHLAEVTYAATHNHASEQYAFSVVLQRHTHLMPCEEFVRHYWYRVEKQVIDDFLATEMTSAWQGTILENRLGDVRRWTSELPTLLKTHRWILRDKAIQELHEKRWRIGFGFGLRYLLHQPTDGIFIKDMLYHLRRMVLNRP